MALEYFTTIASRYPHSRFWVGGHSKGGNLAVYATVFAPKPLQDRIDAVYNNDGPGFQQSLLNLPAYQCLRNRIFTIVPQSSVVGMLLFHEET
jgi:hypothetical protein